MSNSDLTCPRCRGTGQLQIPPVVKKSLNPWLIIGLVFGAFTGIVLMIVMVLTALGGKVKSDFEAANASVPTSSVQAPALAPVVNPTVMPIPVLTPEVIQSNELPPAALPSPIDSQLIPVAPAPSRRHTNTRNRSTNTRNNEQVFRRAGMTTEEIQYVKVIEKVFALVQPPAENNEESPQVYFAKQKANIEQARALHFSVATPPRFAKADSLISDGLQKAYFAMLDIDNADAMGLKGDDVIASIRSQLSDADALLNAGREEIGRVIGHKA